MCNTIHKIFSNQFVRFGLVGLTNTVLSYLINVIVLFFISRYQVSWDYLAGNTVAFFISVLWSFYWNNKVVFTTKENEKRSLGRALLKTYLSYGFTGIILNNAMSWVWIDMLSISKYIAPLLNLIVSVPINFLLNKFWAFRGERKE